VSFEEGQELADHYRVRFLETSAKDSRNVESAFTTMTKEIKARVAHTPAKGGGTTPGGNKNNVDLGKGAAVPSQQKSGGCC